MPPLVNSGVVSRPRVRFVFGILLLVAGVVLVVLSSQDILALPYQIVGRFWITGGAALGLCLGLTTGFSAQTGAGKSFVSLVGSEILVAILGGIGSLLGGSEEVKEEYEYASNQIVKKVTTTLTSFPTDSPHPLDVAGIFFVAFSVLAILGIIGGVLLRQGATIEVKMN